IATGLTMVFFTFLSSLFRYLGLYCMAPIRSGILRDFRRDIYAKVISLPLSFFHKHKKGDLLNRMGTDVQEVEWSIISSIQIFCRDPFMLLFFLTALFIANTKLTIISLVVLPLSGLFIAAVGKSIKRNATKAQEVLGKMSVKFDEAINGLRIIKGYNIIEQTAEDFKKDNDYHAKVSTKILRINEMGAPLVELLSIVSLAVILLIGSSFVFTDPSFKGEVFVMYIVCFARLIQPAKQLVSAYYTIQKGKAAAQRIEVVMDADNVIQNAPDAQTKSTFNENIVFNNVTFSYQEDPHCEQTGVPIYVLQDINIEIKKGEKIAVVGPSGGGKSTLVDLLPRFYDIQHGEICIDNLNNKKIILKDLRDLIGIVNQDTILFNDTVFNNIAFGQQHVAEERVIEAAKMAQAHDFVSQLPEGYGTMIGDRGLKLSGGQRQRLSIARTFLKNPQILILDEATSALDNESEFLVQQALETLLEGKTAIIIAHRLSTIRNADRILFLRDGRVAESGTHQELMELHGHYARFYQVQQV
ncbi:ABC transporter ATP-binding protein/permease, partial [Bacteroidales bacterium OttesenSCG-928-A14]|nr:ABC transporter ATP-binding protein/permease [Bacteroidales bacterium OttesenSCG-928-A14]